MAIEVKDILAQLSSWAVNADQLIEVLESTTQRWDEPEFGTHERALVDALVALDEKMDDLHGMLSSWETAEEAAK